MVELQVVTEQDLQPAGWICEACKTPFQVGDTVVGQRIGRMSYPHHPLLPLVGAWRCRSCYLKEVSND
jgi:hypothetical protein